jgi:iron complex outermembrane receptor protein
MTRFSTLLLAGVSLLPIAAHAQSLPDINVYPERAPAPASAPAPAAAAPETSAPNATRVTPREIANYTPRGNDLAQALSNQPGLSFFTGGGVSSLPVIHGLNDDRNAVVLGGVPISAACANHMNPPLSYLDPAAVGRVEVFTANVPVSKGGDSIGGAILVTPRAPVFASGAAPVAKAPAPFGSGLVVSGSVSGSYRSNGDGFGVAGHIDMATEHFSLHYDGAWSKANNYKAGGGAVVAASAYDANNHAATLSYQNDGQLISFRYAHQAIPYQGFPNQQMDMLGNNANSFDLSYKGAFGWGRLEGNAYYHITQHYMNFLADRNLSAMPMPMYVNGQDYGANLKAEIDASADDLVRVGSELHLHRMKEWWPPSVPTTAPWMCCGTYVNLNNAQRNMLSTYVEWERHWNREWSTQIGLRNDTVWMNTGKVVGYDDSLYGLGLDGNPGTFGSDGWFNAQNRARTFVNFDATALARYTPSDTARFEAGYTLKQRAPSIYELYAWSTNSMAANMIGWFGDGNGYVGNLDLKPETAHSISISGQWSDPTQKVWNVKLTPYYTYVRNYIDVDVLGAGNPGNLLQFANHDAQLAGVDLSGSALLLPDSPVGDISLSGVLGYVYGRRTDGYFLYHMMPFNAKVALEDAVAIGGGRLTGAFEVRAVAAKTNVETLRLEPSTPGFATMNLRAAYEWQNLRFDLGVDNIADRLYYEPLGGIDISDVYAGTKTWGQPLAAQGRTVYGGVTVKF